MRAPMRAIATVLRRAPSPLFRSVCVQWETPLRRFDLWCMEQDVSKAACCASPHPRSYRGSVREAESQGPVTKGREHKGETRASVGHSGHGEGLRQERAEISQLSAHLVLDPKALESEKAASGVSGGRGLWSQLGTGLPKRVPDNDHSSSQLSAHKALTCPEGQSVRAVTPPWLARGNSLRAEIIILGVAAH